MNFLEKKKNCGLHSANVCQVCLDFSLILTTGWVVQGAGLVVYLKCQTGTEI